MAARIRTFVAVDFEPEPLRELLDDLRGLGRPVRVTREPLHLTLKFLGDTDLSAIGRIAEVIEDTAARETRFEVSLRGVDAFPRRERPAVVWVGLSPGEPFVRLAETLADNLETLGFLREARPFQPHITVARVKGRPPGELTELLELYDQESFGVATVGELSLYQSELTSRGPRYTTLSTSRLRT